jgi:tRNA(Ile)-lysidine synthase
MAREHPLLTQVHDDCLKKNLLTKNSTLIVGLSGGPDSVALLSLLTQLKKGYGLRLIAAHLDHQWRPTSEQDVLFCKQLAQSLGNEFVHQKAEHISLTKKPGSQEERGRLQRRIFFEECARAQGAQAIALGHHADDQQETFFLRMIRGASIAGLSVMKPHTGLYIRPLLKRTKQELLTYLDDQHLGYLTDETNADTQYLRNAIRKEALPALRSCDGRFDISFFKTLEEVQETDEYLDRVTKELFSSLANEGSISIEKFLATDSFLHNRLLVQWFCHEQVPFTPSRAFFNEIVRFLKNPAKEHSVHPAWYLSKTAGTVSIKRKTR